MTSSNRVYLAGVPEAVYGETPVSARMRKQRVTSIGLDSKTEYVDSDDIRDDRMNTDPTRVGESNTGNIGIEWHYPPDNSLLYSEIRSAFCRDWQHTPSRDNDGTADSVITDVSAATQIVTVVNGPAFVAGHLVYFTGFGQAANRKKLAKCTTGSATAPAFVGAGLVNEPAPAAAARMVVVGFEGGASAISAVADGLASDGTLDFTVFGIPVGSWLKIGGKLAGNRYAMAGCNGWARVCGEVTANKIPLDNLPAAWAPDDGNGKSVRVFLTTGFIKNGVDKYGLTLERGFVGQAVPTYIPQWGQRTNTLEFGGQAKGKATGSISFMGMGSDVLTTPVDAMPDKAPDTEDFPAMTFGANCGRVGYGGAALGNPDWARAVKFTLNNNLRELTAVSDGDEEAPAPVDVSDGSFDVAVEMDTYFGSAAILRDIRGGVQRGVNTRLTKGNRAMTWEAPRLTPREGNPNVGGKNQDVTLPLKLTASRDALTDAHLLLSLHEYFE